MENAKRTYVGQQTISLLPINQTLPFLLGQVVFPQTSMKTKTYIHTYITSVVTLMLLSNINSHSTKHHGMQDIDTFNK